MSIGTKQILCQLKYITLVILLASGCGPAGQSASPVAAVPVSVSETEPDQVVIEQELVPTYQEPTQDDKQKIQYEKPAQIIKNPYIDIYLGLADVINVKMRDDQREKKIIIHGLARVFDNKKKEIDSTEFSLSGAPHDGERTFDLNAQFNEEADSSVKPVVRGRGTCLAVDPSSSNKCPQVVVDFFIAYKGKMLNYQMRIKQIADQKPPGLPQPQTTNPKENTTAPEAAPIAAPEAEVAVVEETTSKAVPVEADLSKEFAEGAEKSIEGPYVAQVRQANITELFANDKAQIIKPKKPIDPVKPEPAKPEPTRPDPKKPVVPVKPTPPPRPENPPVKGNGKIINKNFKETADGIVRPIMQAYGQADRGWLVGATSIKSKEQSLSSKAFFEVMPSSHESYFGTYETAELITRLGEKIHAWYASKIFISSISVKNGGKFGPHLSHQNGTDIDMAYPSAFSEIKFPAVMVLERTINEKNQNRYINHYYPNRMSFEKTFHLFKYAFSQPDIKIERLFVDNYIKRDLCRFATAKGYFKGPEKQFVQNMFEKIEHVAGHGTHFHLRLECSPEDLECRPKLYKKNNGCDDFK